MEFIKAYFTAEKSESLIFMVIGIIAISFSVYALFKWDDSFYKGFAIPVILIALIQIVVGSTLYFRTDKQINQLETLYQQDKTAFTKAETPRIDTVMKKLFALQKSRSCICGHRVVTYFLCSDKRILVGYRCGNAVARSIDAYR